MVIVGRLARAVSAALPHLSYLPWMDILIQCCRQTIFVTLMETAAASYLMEQRSVHVSMYLDQFARVVIPLDFFIMLLTLFVVGTSDPGYLFGPADNNHKDFEDGLKILSVMTWVNAISLVLAGWLFSVFAYRRLRSTIMNDPVLVYSKVHCWQSHRTPRTRHQASFLCASLTRFYPMPPPQMRTSLDRHEVDMLYDGFECATPPCHTSAIHLPHVAHTLGDLVHCPRYGHLHSSASNDHRSLVSFPASTEMAS